MPKATGAAKAMHEKYRGKMRQPEAGRPVMPALYGIGKAKKGTMKWAEVCCQLEASRNYWICTTRSDGLPHAMPVWGINPWTANVTGCPSLTMTVDGVTSARSDICWAASGVTEMRRDQATSTVTRVENLSLISCSPESEI
jgi:hypothetical protein